MPSSFFGFFLLILYQKSSCICPFVNIWFCTEKGKATKRIVKSDLMCFAKQRESSNCIVDIVQMNFFAAIGSHPWCPFQKTILILSFLQVLTALTLSGNPYQNYGRVRTHRSEKWVRIWMGTKPNTNHRPFQIPYQKMYWIKNNILNKISNVYLLMWALLLKTIEKLRWVQYILKCWERKKKILFKKANWSIEIGIFLHVPFIIFHHFSY